MAEEGMVKKTAILMMVLMLTILASAAVAGDRGEGMVGRLFLFQKCDSSLITDIDNYDAYGCPTGEGPWPIIPDNRRWGQMNYNLLGSEFKFSFQGKNVLPETDYRLIYYPDPWPGNGLICLGGGVSNDKGNLQIHGKMEIPSGLPVPYDANYYPTVDSGAVGAKIWLVPAADIQCDKCPSVIDPETGMPDEETWMEGWNPEAYLFEGNLIVYQYVDAAADDDADGGVDDGDEQPELETVSTQAGHGKGKDGNNGNSSNNGNGNANGKNK